jgi:AcrR family transcriptional regulator
MTTDDLTSPTTEAEPPRVDRDTAARILAVAVELFAARGYAGTSVRDITERLGITKAALYYHFASKEEIIAALIAPFRHDLQALMASADRGEVTAEEMLGRLVEVVSRRGAVILALVNDPSVISHAHQSGPKEDFRRFSQCLANLAGVPLLRALCALGAIHAGIFGLAASRAPQIDARRARELVEGQAAILDEGEQAEVVASGIRALGVGVEPGKQADA